MIQEVLMKIRVLNGSPRGRNSILMPYVRADHACYKKNGLHNFPHNDLPRRAHTLFLSLFLSIPPVRKKAEPQMNQHRIQPFARVFSESPALKQRAGKD